MSGTFGWIERTDSTFSSYAFGLSVTNLLEVGIIGEMQASVKANPVGIGYRLRANLNLYAPYISAGVVFALGWMP